MTIGELARIQVLKVKDLVLCLYQVVKYTENIFLVLFFFNILLIFLLLTKLIQVELHLFTIVFFCVLVHLFRLYSSAHVSHQVK